MTFRLYGAAFSICVCALCGVGAYSKDATPILQHKNDATRPISSEVSKIEELNKKNQVLNVRIAILETKVDDLSNALLEQTGIFSAIILIAVAFVGFISYRGLRREFSEKVGSLNIQLKQENKKRKAEFERIVKELGDKLIKEDNKRDADLSNKLTETRKKLEDTVEDAMGNVYRALAYALRDNSPLAAAIWMLRAARSIHKVRHTFEPDVEYLKTRLSDVVSYISRVDTKTPFTNFSSEALEIVDQLSEYDECLEVLKNIRIEFNRILTLPD